MGVFTAIGAFLLGTPSDKSIDLVGDTVRGVGTWIDERNFTEEEKSKVNMELAVKYANFLDTTMQENTERSKTRRSLAIWIIRLEAMFLIMSALTYKIDAAWSEYWYKIAVDSAWGLLTLGVGAFFFGVHMLRAMAGDKQSNGK